MDLPQRVRMARDHLNITSAEFGRRLNIKPQAVYQWESGETKPSNASFQKIARLTGVSLDWLISGDGVAIPDDASSPDGLKGRVVPRILWSEIDRSAEIVRENRAPYGRTSFECGPRTFQAVIVDAANEEASDPRDAIYQGDIATIDPDAPLKPGAMVVVKIGDQTVVRQYRPRFDHVELAPLNHKFSEYRVPELTDAMLVGIVIETARKRD